MSELQFPFPASITEAIAVLNDSWEQWNLSLFKHDHQFYLFDGDQPMIITGDEAAVRSFLAGTFLATYGGKGLDQIRRELEEQQRQCKGHVEELRAERAAMRISIARSTGWQLLE